MPAVLGGVYGKLTVIKDSGRRSKSRGIIWSCQCSCGGFVEVWGADLVRGTTKSCGCISHGKPTHGLSLTKEYRTYQNMKQRCNNKKSINYKYYGGRGICCEFHTFESFYDEVGKAPSLEHSIDRVDNNGHYTVGNCRWATKTEQQLNRRNNIS